MRYGVLWNLFLAIIPVVLGYILAWGLTKSSGQRRMPLVLCLPVAILWFIFLPNTCYLLTEWRHLLFDERWADLLNSGREDRIAMLRTAKWALFFLAYSGSGALLFTLSIRPMERWLRAAGHPPYLYAPAFFFLVSLGVYQGLILRLNSWDLWDRPGYVWQTAVDAVSNPALLGPILIFSVLLWGMYEAIDLWADGVMERLQRWGVTIDAPYLRAA